MRSLGSERTKVLMRQTLEIHKYGLAKILKRIREVHNRLDEYLKYYVFN